MGGPVKLRKRCNPGGSVSWQLDYGMVAGKRMMRSFETEEAANTELEKAKAARKTHGDLGVVATSGEMADFLLVKQRLGSVPVTTAVDFYLAHAARLKKAMTVEAAVTDYLWDRKEARMGKRALETMGTTLRSLARWFPKPKAVHELGTEELRGWLRGQDWAPVTQNHRLGHLRTFLAWCRAPERRFAVEDVTVGIELARLDDEAEGDGEPGTLTVHQCEKLLLAALKEPVWMGYVALGLFAGIRRCELERTRWDRLSLEEGTFIVAKGAAKGKLARRVIDLEPAPLAWLKAALRDPVAAERVSKNRTIAPSNLKEKWPEFWPKCGLKVWPNNALRHTYASMDYAHWQDVSRLQARMGHTSAKMLHEHYRALKTRKEAAAFWALMPPGPEARPGPEPG